MFEVGYETKATRPSTCKLRRAARHTRRATCDVLLATMDVFCASFPMYVRCQGKFRRRFAGENHREYITVVRLEVSSYNLYR